MAGRISTGLRYPPLADQRTVLHRHFRLDGDGLVEHQHAIGRRIHEHLAHRLGPVLLSWVDHDTTDKPQYDPDDGGWSWVFTACVISITVLGSLWMASGAAR